MKTKTQLKVNRYMLKLNNFIMDVVCYPVDKLERVIRFKIKRFRNTNRPDIYNYIELK